MVIFLNLIIIQQCSVSTTRDKNSWKLYIYIDSLSLVTITVINTNTQFVVCLASIWLLITSKEIKNVNMQTIIYDEINLNIK